MKVLKFIFVIATLILLTGCSSTNTDSLSQESYNMIKEYQQKVGGKCMQYICNDCNMSGRDKNTYIIYYKNMDEFLKNVEVKK